MKAPAIRIGLALSYRTGRSCLGRTIATAISALLGSLFIFAIISAREVSDAEHQKDIARSPVYASSGGLAYLPVDDRIDGQNFERIFVAKIASDAPVPPGLPLIPTTGQAYVSPALLELLRQRNVEAMARLHGLELLPIQPQGLTNAHEYRAYIGSAANALASSQRVVAFGNSSEVERPSPQLQLAAVALLIAFVVLPTAAGAGLSARIAASRRRSRLRALYVLGVSSGQLRMLSAMETVVPTMVGSVAGYFVFLGLRSPASGHVFGSVQPFESNLQVGLLFVPCVMLALTFVALLSGLLMCRGLDQPTTRPSLRPHTQSLWQLAPLAVGLATWCCAALVISGKLAAENVQLILLDGAAVIVCSGVLVGASALISKLAGLIAPSCKKPATSLAARKLQFDPGPNARIAAVTLVIVFVLGFSASIQSSFRLPNHSALMDEQVGGATTGLVVNQTQTSLDLRHVRAKVVIPQYVARQSNGASTVAVPVNCAELHRLTRQLFTCPSYPFVLDSDSTEVPNGSVHLGDTGKLRNLVIRADGRNVSVPSTSGRKLKLRLSSDAGLEGAIVLGHAYASPTGELPLVPQATIAVRAGDKNAMESAASSVIRDNPAAEVTFAGQSELSNNQHYASYGTVVMIASVMGALLSLGSVASLAVDGARSRSRELLALDLIGVPRKELRSELVLSFAVPALVAATAGSVIAHFFANLYIKYEGAGGNPWRYVTIVYLAAVLIVGLLTFLLSKLLTNTELPGYRSE